MPRWLRRLLIAAPFAIFALVLLGALAAHHDSLEGPDAKPLPGPPLRELGRERGLLIGTAADDGALRHEPGYRKDLAQQFSSLTPENAMKWAVVEPEQGKHDWTGADRAVAFARTHDIDVRGHTLVWYTQLPGWLQDGQFGKAELRKIMLDHIALEMGRYKGRIRTWDVVNEVVGDDGKLRPSIWSDTLGPSFVVDAFEAARKADPEARLAINEIGAETLGRKSDKLLEIVKDLKARGLVDEVGFQAHFNLENGVPASMRDNLRRFSALGVDVAITEADVGVQQPPDDQKLEQQAVVYRGIVDVCRAVPRCHSITVWGFTDRHSWIPSSSPGYGTATLLDDELRAKPAYRAFAAALAAP
jgi:endo-1,4-beta-xylanase